MHEQSNWQREMTIELRVERAIDRLDAKFMNGEMGQNEYDTRMKAIRDWADKESEALDRARIMSNYLKQV